VITLQSTWRRRHAADLAITLLLAPLVGAAALFGPRHNC